MELNNFAGTENVLDVNQINDPRDRVALHGDQEKDKDTESILPLLSTRSKKKPVILGYYKLLADLDSLSETASAEIEITVEHRYDLKNVLQNDPLLEYFRGNGIYEEINKFYIEKNLAELKKLSSFIADLLILVFDTNRKDQLEIIDDLYQVFGEVSANIDKLDIINR